MALQILDEGIAHGDRAHDVAVLLLSGSPSCSGGAVSSFVPEMAWTGVRAATPCCSPPQHRRTPADFAHLQRARICHAATGPDRVRLGGSRPVYWFRAPLSPSAACPRPGSQAGSCKPTTGIAPSATAECFWAKRSVQLGHHLPADLRACGGHRWAAVRDGAQLRSAPSSFGLDPTKLPSARPDSACRLKPLTPLLAVLPST